MLAKGDRKDLVHCIPELDVCSCVLNSVRNFAVVLSRMLEAYHGAKTSSFR